MVSRRRVLAATGLCLASAGCLSPESGTDDVVDIHAVSIHNEDAVARTLTVLLTEVDGTAAFEETVSVEPNGGREFPDPVTDAADYTVAVTLGDTTAREHVTAYLGEGESCAIPMIRVDETGRLHIRFLTYDSC